MTLKEKCNLCGRHNIQTQMEIGQTRYVIFKCGHVNSTPLALPHEEIVEKNEIISAPKTQPTQEDILCPSCNQFGQLHDGFFYHTFTKSCRLEGVKNDVPTQEEYGGLEFSKISIDEADEISFELSEKLKGTGKIELINKPWIVEDKNLPSCDGSMLSYNFQTEGVEFIKKTKLRCLIADATGLGKTIQALLALRENREIAFPVLILVKSSLIYQWSEEYRKWCDPTPFKLMPVITKDHLMPGFDAYVMSMDLLARMKSSDLLKLAALEIKTVVLDEVHNYKNPETSRSRNLIKYIQDNEIEQIIALSATPIKNRADEYFTILNLLDPSQFYSKERFKHNWLTQNDKYQWTRINPYRLDDFKALTSNYILRREKHDVLTNLPALSRNYVYVEIEDEALKKSYNKALDLFSNYLNDTPKLQATELLGWLAKLRSITGQAKVQNAIDFAQEHLDSTDENLTIGIHHVSVRDTIKLTFQSAGYSCESLSGEDSSYRKSTIVTAFQRGDFRLLILNMKSGGEGLNLQNCANALVLERAWNAADEEQFEGRFHRNGQVNAVSVTYFIARGTIDSFFHEMVSKKRQIVGETLVKDWNFTSDSDSIRELSEIIVRNKL